MVRCFYNCLPESEVNQHAEAITLFGMKKRIAPQPRVSEVILPPYHENNPRGAAGRAEAAVGITMKSLKKFISVNKPQKPSSNGKETPSRHRHVLET